MVDVVLDVSVEVERELDAVDVEVDGEVGVTTIPQGSISVNCRC